MCTLLTTFDGLTLVVAKILIKQNCPSFPQLSQYFMNLHRLLHEVTESTHKRDPSCHPSQRQFATHLKYNSTSSDTQLDRVLEACLIPNPNRIRTGSGAEQGRGRGRGRNRNRASSESRPARHQDQCRSNTAGAKRAIDRASSPIARARSLPCSSAALARPRHGSRPFRARILLRAWCSHAGSA